MDDVRLEQRAGNARMLAIPWDVDISTTKDARERCFRALLRTGATLTDHMLVPTGHRLGRGVRALLRVQVPVGVEERFRKIAQPLEMKRPSAGGAGAE